MGIIVHAARMENVRYAYRFLSKLEVAERPKFGQNNNITSYRL